MTHPVECKSISDMDTVQHYGLKGQCGLAEQMPFRHTLSQLWSF